MFKSHANAQNQHHHFGGLGFCRATLRNSLMLVLVACAALLLCFPAKPAAADSRPVSVAAVCSPGLKTWDGGGTTNNWSEAANWCDDSLPAANSNVVFDSTSAKNATIDVAITVGEINIKSGYTPSATTGTITQATDVTVTTGPFRQADGTFSGGNGTITINNSFILTGGTFTSTSGTLFANGDFSDSPASTFQHHEGTVTFDNPAVNPGISNTESFKNLNLNALGRAWFIGNFVVEGTLALNSGDLRNGTIEARGQVTISPAFGGNPNNGTVLLANSMVGARTLTLAPRNKAADTLPRIILNDSAMTINTTGSGTLRWLSLMLQAGTVNQGGVAFVFGDSYNQSGGTFNGSTETISITDANFTQSGGTFNGGSGNIDIDVHLNNSAATLAILGGVFNSTSGTLFIGGSFNNTAVNQFNPNGGTVTLDAPGGTVNGDPFVTNLDPFNKLTFNGTATNHVGNVVVLDALSLNDGKIVTNTIEGRGAVTVGPNFDGGDSNLTFGGGANQTFTNNGGVLPTNVWTINKAAGKVTLASDLLLNTGQTLNITSGVLDQGASFNLTAGPINIGAAGRLNSLGTGDLTLLGNLANAGTLSLNGGGGGCGDADSILIRSSADGTPRTWSGSGSFFLTDVDVKDQTAGSPPGNINVFDGTNSGNNTNFSFLTGCNPTAAQGSISGRILDTNNQPVAGVVIHLSGTQNRKFITDADGFYRFDNVETNGFYTVTPARVNYSFSPSARSFSQIGNQTEATFNGTANGGALNPLDTTEYFVRQQYVDFLGREPDEAGFNFWSDQILECGSDNQCSERRRENVSAAFFLSIEFQQTGYLVCRMYKSAYGNIPNGPVPVRLGEFTPDSRAIGKGVVVNQNGWEALLENNKQAFTAEFVQRSRFLAVFPAAMSPAQFVDQLNQNAGNPLSSTERNQLVDDLTGAVKTRAQVLRAVAEDPDLVGAETTRAFVLMEYFGYLRRNPNDPPELALDYQGYDFWLGKLNQFNGNFVNAEMVKAFILSSEYRQRFGP
jgi:hypothetical protein